MKYLILSLWLLSTMAVARGQTISPDVIASSGNEGTAGQTTVQWTLGEAAINSLSTNSLMITQGFHQPSYLLTAVAPGAFQPEIAISVGPNPARDAINLYGLDSPDLRDVTVQLIDLHGRILQRWQLPATARPARLGLEGIADGAYFLRILSGTQFHSSFKIQKIQ